MSEKMEADGTCLCGNVKFKTRKLANKFSACHCKMCRQWGGGPFVSIDCGDDVEFSGEESISIYDSSDWAERGFCGSCGTHLFYRLKSGRQMNMPLGLFRDNLNPEFHIQYFIDKKPDCFEFSNQTKTLTEAKIMELYGDIIS